MTDITSTLWQGRRKLGLCGNCGKTQALEGRSLCQNCTDTIQYGQKKFRKVHATEISEMKRQRYISLKSAGLCVKCGKTPAAPGRVYCQPCAEYTKAQNLKWRNKQKAMKQANVEEK